jgi:hypothetical protein
VRPFHPFGNRQLLFQVSRKVTVLWSATVIDRYRYLTIFPKFSNLLFMNIYIIFKHRLNPTQHGFCKHNPTSTSLITYLNTVVSSVSSQGQTDSVYFDLYLRFEVFTAVMMLFWALAPCGLVGRCQRFGETYYLHGFNIVMFYVVPHNWLLRRLPDFGLSCGCVKWFHSYLINRQSSVRISGALPCSNVVKSGVQSDSTSGPFPLTYSLMMYVILFKILSVFVCRWFKNITYY